MLQVTCQCGRRLNTMDRNAGRHATCPQCGKDVSIPAPSDNAVTALFDTCLPISNSASARSKRRRDAQGPPGTRARRVEAPGGSELEELTRVPFIGALSTGDR